MYTHMMSARRHEECYIGNNKHKDTCRDLVDEDEIRRCFLPISSFPFCALLCFIIANNLPE